jgi:hypothetical protein
MATLFDAIDAQQSAVPQADRDYMRIRKTAPPDWKIWIAKYNGDDWLKHRCKRMGMRIVEKSSPPVSDDLSCNTQATTLVIRQLCAHIYSSTTMYSFTGYSGVSLAQIWPSTGYNIRWRYAPLIGDDHVVNLSESIGRELPTLP